MADTPSIKTIGIVGAGTMGAGIALACLYADYQVILQDPFPEVLEKASDYIKKFLDKKEQGGKFKHLTLTEKLEDMAPTQVVIEAALEQLELKVDVFSRLDEICPPPAILATNTSTLSVTQVAAATQHPGRVAGMHFFNPAPVLPLVEVVQAAQSSDETIQTLKELAEALGKVPVVTGDTPGFIVNRVARPFYAEALRLLGEGVASHNYIDMIVERGGGFRMGPYKLMDLIGIDINAGAMRSMYEQTHGEPRYRPHPLQMQKLQEGALGRKTGRGFYDYAEAIDEPKVRERKPAGGAGPLVISEGSWAPGLENLAYQAGYTVSSVPDPEEPPAACFVVAGRAEEAPSLLSWYDQSLPPHVPIIAQCADMALSEMAAWVQHPERVIGFDGLFLGNGDVATLVLTPAFNDDLIPAVELAIRSLGREAVWIAEGPAAVLPRIVAQYRALLSDPQAGA